MPRKGVVRRGDLCSGHGGFYPRPAATWSPDVFCNTLNVERYDDQLQKHCDSDSCHIGYYRGVRNIYANRRPIQVVDDPISCGGYCAEGSPDTY